MRKVALITGINGQDGSYLAELLLEKRYDVHGIIRRSSQFNRRWIEDTRHNAQKRGLKYELHYGNMVDPTSLHRVLAKVQPSEVYNLAAQSHVGISFEEPEYATNIGANGVLRILECIRYAGLDCHFYQASTSELFGSTTQIFQNEETVFRPCSPYAIAKLYGYWITRNYRDAYNMHVSNGILFNHESPRRGENFVTRKITYSFARIKAGIQKQLRLGNIDTERDWGFAGDFVVAMWLIMQQEKPDDYVVATGKSHSVRQFVELAANYAGFKIEWEGSGVNEVGRDKKSGKIIVEIDPKFYRPTEIKKTCGDASKAKRILGWNPIHSFDDLVKMMVEYDCDLIKT